MPTSELVGAAPVPVQSVARFIVVVLALVKAAERGVKVRFISAVLLQPKEPKTEGNETKSVAALRTSGAPNIGQPAFQVYEKVSAGAIALSETGHNLLNKAFKHQSDKSKGEPAPPSKNKGRFYDGNAIMRHFLNGNGVQAKATLKPYMHAKMLLADYGEQDANTVALVGSENFSEASLDENRELGVLIRMADEGGKDIIATLKKVFEIDWARILRQDRARKAAKRIQSLSRF